MGNDKQQNQNNDDIKEEFTTLRIFSFHHDKRLKEEVIFIKISLHMVSSSKALD